MGNACCEFSVMNDDLTLADHHRHFAGVRVAHVGHEWFGGFRGHSWCWFRVGVGCVAEHRRSGDAGSAGPGNSQESASRVVSGHAGSPDQAF
jgi:hypothetical protein